MRRVQRGADLVFEGLGFGFGLQIVERDVEFVDPVAQAEQVLVGGIGNIDGAVVLVFGTVADADDDEGQVAHFDPLAQQPVVLRTAGEEVLGVEMRDDGHLPPGIHIFFIDETAGVHLDPVHLFDIRHTAGQHDVPEVAAAIGHRVAALRRLRGNLVHVIGEGGLPQHLHILFGHPDAAALLQAVVRLGGDAGKHVHRIDGEIIGIAHERVEQAVAGAQQHDQHKDAPRHGQTRQAGAHLVAPDGLPDFDEEVAHRFLLIS